MTVRPPGAVRSIAVCTASGWPTASITTAALSHPFARLVGRVRLVHTHGSRQVELVGEPIDADHGDVVVCEGGDDRGHANAAEPHDHDGLAGLRPSGVDDGPAAGEDGATEQRRDHGRHVDGYRHHGATVDDGVGGEAGDP